MKNKYTKLISNKAKQINFSDTKSITDLKKIIDDIEKSKSVEVIECNNDFLYHKITLDNGEFFKIFGIDKNPESDDIENVEFDYFIEVDEKAYALDYSKEELAPMLNKLTEKDNY